MNLMTTLLIMTSSMRISLACKAFEPASTGCEMDFGWASIYRQLTRSTHRLVHALWTLGLDEASWVAQLALDFRHLAELDDRANEFCHLRAVMKVPQMLGDAVRADRFRPFENREYASGLRHDVVGVPAGWCTSDLTVNNVTSNSKGGHEDGIAAMPPPPKLFEKYGLSSISILMRNMFCEIFKAVWVREKVELCFIRLLKYKTFKAIRVWQSDRRWFLLFYVNTGYIKKQAYQERLKTYQRGNHGQG